MRLAKILLPVTLCGLLGGCSTILGWEGGEPIGTKPAIVNSDSFCLIARPIAWSKSDTPDTVEQVKELNALGVRLCGWTGHPVPPPAPH